MATETAHNTLLICYNLEHLEQLLFVSWWPDTPRAYVGWNHCVSMQVLCDMAAKNSAKDPCDLQVVDLPEELERSSALAISGVMLLDLP